MIQVDFYNFPFDPTGLTIMVKYAMAEPLFDSIIHDLNGKEVLMLAKRYRQFDLLFVEILP